VTICHTPASVEVPEWTLDEGTGRSLAFTVDAHPERVNAAGYVRARSDSGGGSAER